MRRQILFRGKRKDNGQWVEGNLVYVKDEDGKRIYPTIVYSYGPDTFDWDEVDPETVGQYIGMLAKGNIKIFEGDKIDHKDDKGMVVIWHPMYVSFGLRKTGWMHTHFFGEAIQDSTECDIIGNIHEQKETI